MELLGIGVPEMALVGLLFMILVGPQRFPEMARQAGRWYRTARAFTDEVMKDVRAAVDEIEEEVGVGEDGVKPIRELADLRRELTSALDDAAGVETPAAEAATAETAATDTSTATAVTSEERTEA